MLLSATTNLNTRPFIEECRSRVQGNISGLGLSGSVKQHGVEVAPTATTEYNQSVVAANQKQKAKLCIQFQR